MRCLVMLGLQRGKASLQLGNQLCLCAAVVCLLLQRSLPVSHKQGVADGGLVAFYGVYALEAVALQIGVNFCQGYAALEASHGL